MNLYCTESNVATYADKHGFVNWKVLGIEKRNELLLQATLDIENFLNQPRSGSGIPFGYGDTTLRDSAVIQTIFLFMGVYDFILIGNRTRAVTSGNYSDGVINIGNTDGNSLSQNSKRLAKNYAMSNGVNTGTALFGRG